MRQLCFGEDAAGGGEAIPVGALAVLGRLTQSAGRISRESWVSSWILHTACMDSVHVYGSVMHIFICALPEALGQRTIR